MARKSTGGSALPKCRGVRRVKGKEVSDKLPPVKKYRISPGVRALAEIRRYQNSTELLIKADIPEASLGDCEGSVLGGVQVLGWGSWCFAGSSRGFPGWDI